MTTTPVLAGVNTMINAITNGGNMNLTKNDIGCDFITRNGDRVYISGYISDSNHCFYGELLNGDDQGKTCYWKVDGTATFSERDIIERADKVITYIVKVGAVTDADRKPNSIEVSTIREVRGLILEVADIDVKTLNSILSHDGATFSISKPLIICGQQIGRLTASVLRSDSEEIDF